MECKAPVQCAILKWNAFFFVTNRNLFHCVAIYFDRAVFRSRHFCLPSCCL